jgi:hypothetical protein
MDSSDSDESFSSIQESLEQLSELVTLFTKQLDVAEKQMSELQPHVEDTHVSLLNGVPFLETSPFRNQMFFVKSPGAMIRNYIFDANLVTDDGVVKLNKQLQTLLGIKSKTATYVELMGRLRTVVV